MLIFGKKKSDWISERLSQVEKRLKDTTKFYDDSKALLDELKVYEMLKKLKKEPYAFLDKDVICTIAKGSFGLVALAWVIKFEKDNTFTPGSKTLSIFQMFTGR